MGVMQKEETIQRILRRLDDELGRGSFVLVPNWDDETNACGVAHPQDHERLAYICSYDDGFFVSLELAAEAGSDAPYADAGNFRSLADAEVVEVVRRHLQIEASDTPKAFRTLRGFLDGEEPDEATYFAFMAALRIHGDDLPLAEIGAQLGVEPTYVHRKGERRRPRSPAYKNDAWHLESGLPETEPLERHIEALWDVVKPRLEYLKSLKRLYKVDVFCGYRSNCDHAGIEVPHTCLQLFTALEVPFGVSIIIA